MTHIEAALVAFSTLVATIGPIETAILFAALTPGVSAVRRRQIAVKAVLIATAILLFFTLFGGPIFQQLGVTLAALQAAGGILLLLIALDMIFMPDSGMFTLSQGETREAKSKDDISVVPLATPIIAGPGAMGGVVLIASKAHSDPAALVTIVATESAMPPRNTWRNILPLFIWASLLHSTLFGTNIAPFTVLR